MIAADDQRGHPKESALALLHADQHNLTGEMAAAEDIEGYQQERTWCYDHSGLCLVQISQILMKDRKYHHLKLLKLVSAQGLIYHCAKNGDPAHKQRIGGSDFTELQLIQELNSNSSWKSRTLCPWGKLLFIHRTTYRLYFCKGMERKIWHLKCEQTKKTGRKFHCICCLRCTAAPLCGPLWSQTLWGHQQDQIWQPHALMWIFFFILYLLSSVMYSWSTCGVTEIILIVSVCKLKGLYIFPLLVKNIQWENIWLMQLLLFSKVDRSTWFSPFFQVLGSVYFWCWYSSEASHTC